jgi:hypothetical protein
MRFSPFFTDVFIILSMRFKKKPLCHISAVDLAPGASLTISIEQDTKKKMKG